MNVTVTITDPEQMQALLNWLWQSQLLEKTIIDTSEEPTVSEDDDDF